MWSSPLLGVCLGLSLVLVAGCPSSGERSPDGGAVEHDGAADASPKDAPRADSAGPDAAFPGYNSHRDCLPECIAALRRGCQRPLKGAGTCVEELPDAGGTNTCYSNGVREQRRSSGDAGAELTVTFTYPDGKTTCYVAEVITSGATIYKTPDGREVARHMFQPDATAIVTCGGQTYTLTREMREDPTCQDLNVGQCAQGHCR